MVLGRQGGQGGRILGNGVVKGAGEGGGEVGEESVFFGVARDWGCWDIGWLDGEGEVEGRV